MVSLVFDRLVIHPCSLPKATNLPDKIKITDQSLGQDSVLIVFEINGSVYNSVPKRMHIIKFNRKKALLAETKMRYKQFLGHLNTLPFCMVLFIQQSFDGALQIIVDCWELCFVSPFQSDNKFNRRYKYCYRNVATQQGLKKILLIVKNNDFEFGRREISSNWKLQLVVSWSFQVSS